MSVEVLVGAFALMLVFEGLLPFLSPSRWRETMAKVAAMSDGQIRFIGLSCMLAGLLALALFVG